MRTSLDIAVTESLTIIRVLYIILRENRGR